MKCGYKMRYTQEICDLITRQYAEGTPTLEIATSLEVPERSIIAKLSSLGVYQRKQYVNKRGETPRKKEELIEKLAVQLGVNLDLLESLEKANKSVLLLLERALDKNLT